MMKGQLDRTKVVLRHLPPSISQAALVEQIDVFFAGRYNWVAFRPGKRSQKNQSYSRAYIDLKRPEDVFDFAEFFDGHLFVNEKGSQFKVIVEYAPSQRVPKHWSKKDGREGTIFRDPEYLEFLEFIAKPAENLPSAETQLERREAERSGAGKDVPIVTPLMDFVRQKRAAKAGSRRLLSNGKTSRRGGASSAQSPTLPMTKRGSERKKNSASMYVVRDARKNTSAKDKSTYTLVPKRDDQQPSKKSAILASAVGTQFFEEESGVLGADAGKKKVLLVKGKEKEISHVAANMSQQHSTYSKNMGGSVVLKQNPRHHDNGRIIKSILLNKDARQSQSSGIHSDQQIQSSSSDRDKRLPRSQHVQLILKDTNGAPDHKIVGNDLHGSYSEKQEKRTRNKDRPDRGVWTPLNRLDGSSASDESLSSAFQPDHSLLDSSEGSHKHHGRRGATHGVKDLDGSPVAGEGKHSKRGYGSHEENHLIKGLCIGQEKVEVSHLQFAEDTIFFLAGAEEVWNNLLESLNLFCTVSGLKINKAKCSLAGINSDCEKIKRAADSWGCEVGSWPIKYLGLHLGGRPRALTFWDPVVEKMEKRLQSWKKAFLSRGGRLTLIQSVLGSLPIYYVFVQNSLRGDWTAGKTTERVSLGRGRGRKEKPFGEMGGSY